MSATIRWRDGLELTRVMTSRGQIVLWLVWNGVKREVRLGTRVGVIRRIAAPRKRRASAARSAPNATTNTEA